KACPPRARPGRGEAECPICCPGTRHCERRVVVRVRPVEPGERAGGRLVEAHAQEQALVTLAEEVLERLLGHLALRCRARGRPDCEERGLQIASRRLGAIAGAEVPADSALRADLEVG